MILKIAVCFHEKIVPHPHFKSAVKELLRQILSQILELILSPKYPLLCSSWHHNPSNSCRGSDHDSSFIFTASMFTHMNKHLPAAAAMAQWIVIYGLKTLAN